MIKITKDIWNTLQINDEIHFPLLVNPEPFIITSIESYPEPPVRDAKGNIIKESFDSIFEITNQRAETLRFSDPILKKATGLIRPSMKPIDLPNNFRIRGTNTPYSTWTQFYNYSYMAALAIENIKAFNNKYLNIKHDSRILELILRPKNKERIQQFIYFYIDEVTNELCIILTDADNNSYRHVLARYTQ